MDNLYLSRQLELHREYIDKHGESGVRACFFGSNMEGINVERLDLSFVDFSRANLKFSRFRKANLSHAIFKDADLRGADLRGADLKFADFSGADLREAYLPKNTYILYGTPYHIMVTPGSATFGCKTFTVDEWRNKSEADIYAIDGKRAISYYPMLLGFLDVADGPGDWPSWITTLIKSKEINEDLRE